MTIGVFTADLLTPLWYDAWVFYLIPLFFMYRSADRPYLYSVVITLLTVLGLFLSPSDVASFTHAATTRLTGILGGWGVSVFLMQLKRSNASLRQTQSELEKRIEERTAELSRANRLLQEDVAKREKVEEALRDSEERYRLLFSKSPIGIFNYDIQLILTALNDRFVELLQSSHEKLLGFDMKTVKDKNLLPALLKPLGGEEGHYEGFYQATTGLAEIWISMRTAPLFGKDGKVSGGIGIVEDITNRKRMEEELRSLSLMDELTGIYNRRGFFFLTDKLLKIAKRQKRGVLMLYADLDGLKDINDTWGHQEGDLALIDIANILKATYRESDFVARIGGDEFVVVPVGSNLSDVGIISDRLQDNIDIHNAT